MRRIRSRTSCDTRWIAASADSPVSAASRTRRSQPSSAETSLVASSTSRAPVPLARLVSISSSSAAWIEAAAAMMRETSSTGSSASRRRTGAPMPCSTSLPITSPGAMGAASNWRGRVLPSPSLTSMTPLVASNSASSIATVSSTSTSSSV